jgi:thiamine-monophosphate kinase
MNPFTTRPAASVGALGELRLIESIRRWLGDASPAAPFGIGDDCAVIPPTRHHQLVTTDPVIHGQHFDDTVPPRDVGAKLLKRNLSDIAAMGGRPAVAVISLALAPGTSLDWLRQFYLGLAATARRFDVKIVGGDITQGPANFLGAFLTLHGESTGRLITRTGARRGDTIFVTGRLGGSRAGHHYRFIPRLVEGQWLARQQDVVAMMDVSDGIAKDIRSLTPPRLVASVAPQRIPASRAAHAAGKASGRAGWEHALMDGEDYELLFVVRRHTDPARFLQRWSRRFDLPLHHLGAFTNKAAPGDVDWASLHGYEHLR